jgi:haloalkane dehalogenase
MNGPRTSRRQFFAAAGAAGMAGLAPAANARTVEPAGDFSGDWRARKKFAQVLDRRMAYYEVGKGRPILFLHGNPTSSYLWRNIIPHVAHLGRCVAPDLIGQGDSDKLPNAGPGTYNYATHRKYLFELMRVLGIREQITLVVHDWGSGLGLDYAQQNPSAIRGIAYMEAILRLPGSPPPDPANARGLFGQFMTNEGENLVLEQNAFVERQLIGGLGFYLSEADKAEYRRPFLKPGADRWATLQWPRELPAYSATVAPIAESYTRWLANDAAIPKLFVHSLPGAIFSQPAMLEFARTLKNQTEVTVYGTHYVQEMAPHAIGRALADWYAKLA